jgi:transcriptional repressor NrdR
MKCPYCHADDSRVIDSRPIDNGEAIRRRRECVVCNKRFTTFEEVEQTAMVVIKRDGRREVFDRNKIMMCYIASLRKASIPVETLHNLANDVEWKCVTCYNPKSPTRQIGEA